MDSHGGPGFHSSHPIYIVGTSRCCRSPVWAQWLLLYLTVADFFGLSSLVLIWPPAHRKNVSLQVHRPRSPSHSQYHSTCEGLTAGRFNNTSCSFICWRQDDSLNEFYCLSLLNFNVVAYRFDLLTSQTVRPEKIEWTEISRRTSATLSTFYQEFC